MTTADMRTVCAEILDGLGQRTYSQQTFYVQGRSRHLRAGAELLRYSRDLEYGDPDAMRDEIDDLRRELGERPTDDDVSDALDEGVAAGVAEGRLECTAALAQVEKLIDVARTAVERLSEGVGPQTLQDLRKALIAYDAGK